MTASKKSPSSVRDYLIRQLAGEEDKKSRKYWTEAVKRRVAARQGYLCNMCQCVLPPAWHADHIVPLHQYGDNSSENCQILCGSCHAEKTQLETISRYQKSREKVKEVIHNKQTRATAKGESSLFPEPQVEATTSAVSKYFDPSSTCYLSPYSPSQGSPLRFLERFRRKN